MANIKEYTDQIASAVYGEEVRGSIINALNKVNDDNNAYNALKEEITQMQPRLFDPVEKSVSGSTYLLPAAGVAALEIKLN